MPELTNTEFAAHLRVAAKMMDCEDNCGNPIVPGIVRSMRKAADIIDTDETAIATLQSENAEKDKEIERLTKKATLNAFVKYTMKRACEELVDTEAALSRVEAERDAAVNDLKCSKQCLVCLRNGTQACKECDMFASNFKWRGAQGVE